MINKEILLKLIDNALYESENHVIKYYNGNDKPMKNTRKALKVLRRETETDHNNINERALRAIIDVGVAAVKMYEETELESRINELSSYLYNNISKYKDLEPLGMDFGKGDPI